jgi:hypothetical protein
MTLYHVTSCDNADQIVKSGLHDPNERRFVDACVWFADKALCGDKMFGDEQAQPDAGPQCAVVIHIPDEVIDEYEDKEFRDDHPDHREWCIPHDVVNRYIGSAHVEPCP